MSSGFHVEWTPLALDDWKRLSFQHATKVAVAVKDFSETGRGSTIYVDGEFLLLIGEHVVVMLIDGDTIHIDGVRRS